MVSFRQRSLGAHCCWPRQRQRDVADERSVPSGDVISESPVAGAVVAPGSAVDLVVSSGTPTTTSGGRGGGGAFIGLELCGMLLLWLASVRRRHLRVS